MEVPEQRFLVKRYEKVDPVDMGSDFPVRGTYSVVTVLSFDVRVVLDVSKDM
jgi:hypothetical protein